MAKQYVERRRTAMVKVGFIVEGNSDVIIIKQSKSLKNLFNDLEIIFDDELVLNARNKPSLKKNFVGLYNNLIKKGAEIVFILFDQDDKEEQKRNKKYKPKECPLVAVKELQNYRDNKNYVKKNQVFIVMTREMEAWFLADKNLGFNYDGNPEEILNPSDLVAAQLGIKSHIRIANRVKDNFSLVRASENSKSARRFLEKLKQIANED